MRQYGFTLLELLAVVLIMGAVLLLVPISLEGVGAENLIVCPFRNSPSLAEGNPFKPCPDEPVNLAAGLLPNFGAGGLDMGTTVGGIVELVGPNSAVRFYTTPGQ